jgi:hypothetical protein
MVCHGEYRVAANKMATPCGPTSKRLFSQEFGSTDELVG